MSVALAQQAPATTWEPIVEVRQRLTLQDAFTDAGDLSPTPTVGQRARLGIEARRLGVSARVSFQETRRWTGARDIVAPDAFQPEIAEGWVRVQGDLTHNVGAEATLGRQAITVHEGRILGADPFSLEGQFFDAVRIEGHAQPFSIEYVNARRFVAAEEDPLGLGVNVLRAGARHTDPLTTWVADGLWVVDARRTAATTSTAGVWLRFDTGRWRSRAEGYVQTSVEGTGTLIGLSGGWVFGPNERLVVHARYDGSSGDDTPAVGGRTAWRPVLGDSHAFNGLMDRFASPSDSDDRGLADYQLVLEAHPAPPLEAGLALHHFRSPLDGGPYGLEVDATGGWSFSPFATARGGAAWFTPTPGFDATQRMFAFLEVDASF